MSHDSDQTGFGWTPEASEEPTVPGTAAFGGAAHTTPAADDAAESDREREPEESDDAEHPRED